MSFDKIIISCLVVMLIYFFGISYIKSQTQITNNENSIVITTQILGVTAVREVPKMTLDQRQEQSISQYLSQAVSENKFILLYFYADWCHNCKNFAPTIKQISEEYKNKCIFVPINADSPETKSLIEIFNVPGYPTVYIINPVSKKYIDGPQDKADLKESLDIFLKTT